MKFLIIGTPRSGTSVMLRTLGITLNVKKYGEPWNKGLLPKIYTYPYDFGENCAVKTLAHHIPTEYENKPILEFYKDLIQSFDKTILIGRKDRIALTESYTYQVLKDKLSKDTRSKFEWHRPYTVDEELPIREYIDEINSYCDLLNSISSHFKIPIDWYEDIYSGDIEKVNKFIDKLQISIDRDLFFKKVNPVHKLRRFNSTLI